MRDLLPRGRTLPYSAWVPCHHAMVGVLFGESIALVIFSFAEGNGWLHSVSHAAGLIPICVIALLIEDRRRAASVLVSLGLITACALLVHIWHGAIEAHFLFFVTIMVAGEDIPLGSRIIAVCDAYDAMVSDRSYRSRLEPEEALLELSRCAGGQFDAEVVAVFGEVLAARERRSLGALRSA